jgi:hypothetical protein
MIKALAAAALIFTAAAPAMADPNPSDELIRCGRAIFCEGDLDSFKQSIKHNVCGMGMNGAEAFGAAIFGDPVIMQRTDLDQYDSDLLGNELASAALEAVSVSSAQGRCRHSNTAKFLREFAEN